MLLSVVCDGRGYRCFINVLFISSCCRRQRSVVCLRMTQEMVEGPLCCSRCVFVLFHFEKVCEHVCDSSLHFMRFKENDDALNNL